MWILPALSLITLAVGQLCKTKCSFLEGDMLGIDLNIIGAVFYAGLMCAALLYRKHKSEWLMKSICAAASWGIGAEILFVRFQIENNTFCPKCLISGFFFVLMFLLASPHLKKWLIALLVALGALFTSLTFNGSVVPSYAAEAAGPEFGNPGSSTELVVYSDYFCPACGKADAVINAALLKLKGKVRIRFVDVPGHKGSVQYARVFLYSWFKSGNSLETAVKVRERLFEEAKNKTDEQKLMTTLTNKGFRLKVDEAAAKEIFLQVYTPAMKMDTINATPTLVVVKGGDRKKFVGGDDIKKALQEISGRPAKAGE